MTNAALISLDAAVDEDLVRGTRTIRPSGLPVYLHAKKTGGRRVASYHRCLADVAGRLQT